MVSVSRITVGVFQLIPLLAVSNALTIEKRALAVPAVLPGTWVSQGCYVDVSGRTLTGPSYSDNGAMTDEACINFCQANGMPYAGTEYSSQCYCGATLAPGAGPATSTDCNMPCTGNAAEACGGPNRLNLFFSGVNPVTNPGPGLWNFVGCYTEGTNGGRALPNGAATTGGSAALTVSLCTTACYNAGYVLAGVEYSGECYCGNAVLNGGGLAPEGLAGCNMLCNGNKSEYCGGPGRLDLYDYNRAVTLPPYTTISSTSSSGSSSRTSSSSSTTYTSSHGSSSSSSSSTSSSKSSSASTSSSSSSSTSSSKSSSTSTSSSSSSSTSSKSSSASTSSSSSNSKPTVSSTTSSSSSSQSSSSSSSSHSITSTSGSSTSTSSSSSSSKPTSSSSSTSASSSSSSSSLSTSKPATSSSSSSKINLTSSPSSSSTSSSTSSASKSSSSSSSSSSVVSSSSTSTSSSPTPSPTLGHNHTLVGWVYQGCYTESTTGRALSASSNYDYPAMTLEECAKDCSGYTYFGVEYGGECYCGNSLGAGSVPVTATGGCSFICPGNQYEYCGAGSQLELYKNTAISTSTTSTTSAGTTSSTSTSTSTSALSIPSSTSIGNYVYQGCYIDGVNGRILSNQLPDNQQLTHENCIASCAAQGYTIAGMEYAVQCFCDNVIYNGGALDPNQADCTTPCSGSNNEMCGGPGGRISIYSVGTPQIYQPPSAQKSGLPANWIYAGCLQDNIPSNENANEILNTFPYMVWNCEDCNTPTACINQCQEYGYNAAGLEYGSECYCGDVENIQVASAPGVNGDPNAPQQYTRSAVPQIVPDSQCNSVCSGDKTKLCGSGNLLSYYAWNGATPLYDFSFPTGYQAGEYSLLIGGVTVPLITAQVVTGKVTFTEKYGTGEPNGTGAYELDLTQINNFDAAWREMSGLQTDVFCSAGIILPDKAGRQMTIGGWAGESNFGIRFYTPDGAPGVKGTNNWEEAPYTLSLQVPRWYPSVMTMANGSLMVIGGEIAQNDLEQPTLELLPFTGVPDPTTINGYSNTTVYLDFLQRTAPFNLYPFVCVLPSGGIFVAYYNEARIIDEVTFETIKELPNMPGSVNNPLAGRTYQLEGTMVLLPQYAPFTAHLQVLICGGSTAVGDDGDPIDNCISTAPEDANPTWTIERMPSRRVMSCIAALPDGTYLILNGAQHGKAGFGLGASPNYNAVLYNPQNPINQRMSIMANTSVARLYHSEAITLLDGRVLVSGSDPSGNYADPAGSFPEEYRVEVFTPPYLLSGIPRPILHVTNLDWSYNEFISIQVNFFNGGTVQVSLLGAVVSTHGNSMGQRTLFLSVSCAGDSCIITTPLNAHVCPPGWYMLFVLEGPTPSVGQWVRVGKDPAKIGLWPAGITGITPPGI